MNAQPVDSATSDSTGHYTFSNVATGFKQLTASAPGFKDTVRIVSVRTAGRTYTVNLELKRVTGTLSGTIHAQDTTGIPDALVFCLGMMNSIQVIDSVRTDSLGNYSIALPAGGYEIQISAPSFKNTLGKPFQDTLASVLSDSTTTLNATLAVATSQIGGTVHRTTATGVGLDSAKVVLQRRANSSSPYYPLDSTYTDAAGIFLFSNLVATIGDGIGTGAEAPNYRLVSGKIKGSITWGTSVTNGAPVNTVLAAAALPVSGNLIVNIALIQGGGDVFGAIRFAPKNISTMGLDARMISVFSLDGKLQRRIFIPAGGQPEFPAAYSPEKGFLFLMK